MGAYRRPCFQLQGYGYHRPVSDYAANARARMSLPNCSLAVMVTPPLPVRSTPRPARWQRWILNSLYYFDRQTIADWLGVIRSRLERADGATPMATARYTVQLIGYAEDARSAAQTLATQGHPAGRALLSDAALDFKAALDRLYPARDALLKAAGADRVTEMDDQ